MKRPKAVKVFNYNYRIRTSKRKFSDMGDVYGWYDAEREVIYLGKDMLPSREREILLHEILHALVKALQLDKTPEEELCTRLAAGLMTVFKDNPKLAKWLTKEE